MTGATQVARSAKTKRRHTTTSPKNLPPLPSPVYLELFAAFSLSARRWWYKVVVIVVTAAPPQRLFLFLPLLLLFLTPVVRRLIRRWSSAIRRYTKSHYSAGHGLEGGGEKHGMIKARGPTFEPRANETKTQRQRDLERRQSWRI